MWCGVAVWILVVGRQSRTRRGWSLVLRDFYNPATKYLMVFMVIMCGSFCRDGFFLATCDILCHLKEECLIMFIAIVLEEMSFSLHHISCREMQCNTRIRGL